jgi:hypothetical protein
MLMRKGAGDKVNGVSKKSGTQEIIGRRIAGMSGGSQWLFTAKNYAFSGIGTAKCITRSFHMFTRELAMETNKGLPENHAGQARRRRDNYSGFFVSAVGSNQATYQGFRGPILIRWNEKFGSGRAG